jgi:hypothetical protein
MRTQHLTKAELLKVIEILLHQIQEEQQLRQDCIEEMLSGRTSLSEDHMVERIKKILESPGDEKQ